MTENAKWSEYESVARYVARFGRVPELMSAMVADLIDADTEAFEQRVRDHAYGLAMEKHNHDDR